MKFLKYSGVVLCVLLIVGTLPSVFLIVNGLLVGQVDQPAYFMGKLIAYIAIIVVLAILSAKLLKSTRE